MQTYDLVQYIYVQYNILLHHIFPQFQVFEEHYDDEHFYQ
jgi:hypothetical protein